MTEKPMKVLFLETFYPEAAEAQITTKTIESFEPNEVRNNFFVDALKKKGHSVERVILNVEPYLLDTSNLSDNRGRLKRQMSLYLKILASLLPGMKPSPTKLVVKFLKRISVSSNYDVVLNANLNAIHSSSLRNIFPLSKIVGLIASPLPGYLSIKDYHLVISSLPPIVEKMKRYGVRSKLLLGSFETSHYSEYVRPWSERDIPVCFVGSIGIHHLKTLVLLRVIAKKTEHLQIFTSARPLLLALFGLKPYFKGKAYGREMFEILGRSKICVNRHAWFARGFSNNMRMFEATGMGALLLTEESPNLHDIFEATEVVSYRGTKDLGIVVEELLADEKTSERIAKSGHEAFQSRHSSGIRAGQLECLLFEAVAGR